MTVRSVAGHTPRIHPEAWVDPAALVIGNVELAEGVTIGHRCVVHACTIGNNVRIGIGAVVLTGAVIEDNAQVGAGAVVPPGKIVPSGTLVMGVPAKPVRQMNEDELDDIRGNAIEYLELWQKNYRDGASRVIG